MLINTTIVEKIRSCALDIRDTRVLIANDLSELYGMKAQHLNERLRANIEKFQENKHYFYLTEEEKQEVVDTVDRLNMLKYSPSRPVAYTLYGILKIAFYVKSDLARQMSDYVIEAFVEDRVIGEDNRLRDRVEDLEKKLDSHDRQLGVVLNVLKSLVEESKDEEERVIIKGFISKYKD